MPLAVFPNPQYSQSKTVGKMCSGHESNLRFQGSLNGHQTEIQLFEEKQTDGAVNIWKDCRKNGYFYVENVTKRKSEKEFLDSNILLLENEALFTEKDYWIL